MTSYPHYLRFGSRPLCEHMGCLAGLRVCEEAGVTSCSYPSRRKARAAAARLNVRGRRASVVMGECPAVAQLEGVS